MSRGNWDKVYSQLETRPDDFELWQDLVDAVEGLEGGLNKTSSNEAFDLFRFTYDRFLEIFPLFHGFWIRYADLEFRLGFTERAETVYERAVSVLNKGSVELWKQYCEFKVLVTVNKQEPVRLLFERAANAVGSHYLSHEFWDLYLEFEEREGDMEKVYNLLDRIIRTPIHQYARYFEKLQHVRPLVALDKLVTPEYLQQFKAEYEIDREEQLQQQTVQMTKTQERLNQEEERDIRDRIASYHIQIYENTQLEVSRRWRYESSIKTPFFLLEHPDETEMVNWRDYIAFEIVENDFDRICLTFERAVMATGLDQAFWIDYTRYLIATGHFSEAYLVFVRGCSIVPVGRTELRHQFARFVESRGYVDLALDIYKQILDNLPSSVETILSYSAAISRAKASAEQGLEYLEKSLTAMEIPLEDKAPILLQYAKTLLLLNRLPEAQMSLQAYTKLFSKSYYFWRHYLEFEFQNGSVAEIKSVFEKIKTGELEDSEKKDLAHIYMDYILSESPDVTGAINDYFDIDCHIHKHISVV